jgi:hypothetical protein
VCPILCTGNPDTTTNLWPDLIIFVDGDVRLANFAVHLDVVPATTGWLQGFFPDFNFTFLISGIRVMKNGDEAHLDPMSFSMDHVSIEGTQFDGPDASFSKGYNVLNCAILAGELLRPGKNPIPDTFSKELDTYPLRGRFTLRRNSARTCLSGFDVDRLLDSTLTVGGGEDHGNRTSDVFFGIELPNAEGSRIEAAHNKLAASGGAGVVVYSEYQTHSRSEYSIHDNDIVGDANADGVLLMDNESAPRVVHATVARNSFRGGSFTAMVHAIATNHTLVGANRLSGRGTWGIAFESVSDSTILGNDIGKVQAEVARIFLDSHTSGTLVAGRCSSGDVVDQGTRNRVICSGK